MIKILLCIHKLEDIEGDIISDTILSTTLIDKISFIDLCENLVFVKCYNNKRTGLP
jgi:hypothetical protein